MCTMCIFLGLAIVRFARCLAPLRGFGEQSAAAERSKFAVNKYFVLVYTDAHTHTLACLHICMQIKYMNLHTHTHTYIRLHSFSARLLAGFGQLTVLTLTIRLTPSPSGSAQASASVEQREKERERAYVYVCVCILKSQSCDFIQ